VEWLPSGGIGADTAPSYLALPSVLAVGGSWLAPAAAVAAHDWEAVTIAAKHAVTAATAAAPE
jgi:2-dehydro-3-deoxyphosphogluconate aldolase/(4S)-4-hydroxy-2-oxoglutarate aldolase